MKAVERYMHTNKRTTIKSKWIYCLRTAFNCCLIRPGGWWLDFNVSSCMKEFNKEKKPIINTSWDVILFDGY